jgi:predicted nucleotidyltransferase
MEIFIKVNGLREKLRVKALLLSKDLQFILVSGKTISNTVKEKKCGNKVQLYIQEIS